jgi:zinc D-Ala-D-Ala carboxypeptidase
VARSSHLTGYAADVKVMSDAHRYDLLDKFFMAGFNRIGLGKNFIHVDCDPNKNEDRIWVYS